MGKRSPVPRYCFQPLVFQTGKHAFAYVSGKCFPNKSFNLIPQTAEYEEKTLSSGSESFSILKRLCSPFGKAGDNVHVKIQQISEIWLNTFFGQTKVQGSWVPTTDHKKKPPGMIVPPRAPCFSHALCEEQY
jgi:hypothetical protein